MNSKIIVFEEIFQSHRWIVVFYLFMKCKIYFIRPNKISKNKKWFKYLITKRFIEKINYNLELHGFDGVYYDVAFDNMDTFYQYVSEVKLLKKIREFYNDDNIDLSYKHNIKMRLARIYYLNHIMHKIQNTQADKKIVFIPSFGTEIFFKSDGCEINDYRTFRKQARAGGAFWLDTRHVIFPLWAVISSYTACVIRKCKIGTRIFGFLPYVIYLALKNAILRYPDSIKSFYKYAIMIISPLRQFANRIQKVDFLIDCKMLEKKDVIFLSCKKLNKHKARYMKDNGLNFLDDIDRFVSIKDIKRILPICYLLVIYFLREDSLISDTVLRTIFFYLRWHGLGQHIVIKNLITYADFGIQSISRNIILNQKGCRTHYYMDSINYECFYVKEQARRHRYTGFLYYDNYFVWNDIISDHFKASKNHVKKYINLGCLWAEHVRLIEEGRLETNFKDRLYNAGYRKNMKLISVFDSVYHDDGLTTYSDGIIFLNDIFKLLHDLNNIFVVLKERTLRDYHRKTTDKYLDILNIFTSLEKHPRCYCIKNSWENSSEIMSFSDLVISFPFSSPTVEALSARKKAVWHDPTNKFQSTFYDNIPGIVCHSYNELRERTTILLDMKKETYNTYLNRYIKGTVESYLDGMAITRFREHLAKL